MNCTAQVLLQIFLLFKKKNFSLFFLGVIASTTGLVKFGPCMFFYGQIRPLYVTKSSPIGKAHGDLNSAEAHGSTSTYPSDTNIMEA